MNTPFKEKHLKYYTTKLPFITLKYTMFSCIFYIHLISFKKYVKIITEILKKALETI